MKRRLCILSAFLSVASVCLPRSVQELDSIAKSASRIGEYAQAAECYADIIGLLPDTSVFDDDRVAYAREYTSCQLLAGGYAEVEELLSAPVYSGDFTLRINLAAALGYQERYEEAYAVLDSLLSDGDLTDAFKGIVFQNIGYLNYEERDFNGAESNLRKAEKYFDGEHRYITISNLALCLARNGKFTEASSLIAEALDGFRSLGQPAARDYIRALRKQAEIYFMKGERGEARRCFSKYYTLEKRWLIDNLPLLSTTQRLNLWMSEKAQLARCFVMEDYDPEFLYEVAMFRRQTSLLGTHNIDKLTASLSRTVRDVRESLEPGSAAVEFVSYTDINGEECYAAVILPYSGAAKFVKLFPVSFVYETDIIGPKSVFDAIKSERRFDKEALYSSARLGERVWRPVVDALPSGTKDIYFAPEGIFHFWGIENMPFENKRDYNLRRVSTTADIKRDSQTEYDNAKMLLIGGLNYSSIPAATNYAGKNQIAAEMLKRKVGTTGMFDYLPATRMEVDSIHRTFSNARKTYLAEEGYVKQLLPGFDVVHIATHGYSLNLGIRKRPELLRDSLAYDESLRACALALTGANVLSGFKDRDDGLLSARELCDVDLSAVDFVVLSACQTAQGDITDEGSAGLIRGLKNAGVKTVMATLWSVDDRSTMIFMNEFYRLLRSGRTKYEAYTGAQEYLCAYEKRVPVRRFSPRTLASGKETDYIITKYDSPYYWAPFILID